MVTSAEDAFEAKTAERVLIHRACAVKTRTLAIGVELFEERKEWRQKRGDPASGVRANSFTQRNDFS